MFLDVLRRRLVRYVMIGAYILAPLVVVSLAELLVVIAQFPSGESGQWPVPTPLDLREDVPLNVVILLFDELDYEFVFSDEEVTGNLPNFRALTETSLVMHNVETTHENTIQSISELFTGMEILSVDLDGADTRLVLPTEQSIAFKDQRTLFDVPIAEGYHTAIFGSYYRYCENFVKTEDLNPAYCRSGGNDRLLSSLLSPYQQALATLPTVPPINAPTDSGVAHRRLLKVLNGGTGIFAYAHYTIPHTPFRYNPDSHDMELFRTFSYIDNVRFADALLGEVIQTLKRSGTWDETMLVVTSDHFYREKPDKGDTRIPLFLKLPNMSTREDINLPWNHRSFLPLIEEMYRSSSFDPVTVKEAIRSLSNNASLYRTPTAPAASSIDSMETIGRLQLKKTSSYSTKVFSKTTAMPSWNKIP